MIRILLVLLLTSFVPVSNGASVEAPNLEDKTYGFFPLEVGAELDQLVTSVAQDNTGFVWIGTQVGLYRYDGYELFRFSHTNSVLPSESIYSITKDRKGRLWIGTDRGAAVYIPDDGFFRNIVFPEETLFPPRVFDILQREDSEVWLASSEGLFFLEDYIAQKVDGPVSNAIPRSLVEDANSTLLVGTEREGLFRKLDNGFVRIGSDYSLGNISIRELLLDSEGYLWVGTLNSGLLRWSPETQKVTRFDLGDDSDSNRVRALLEDSSNTIWVGSDEGIHRWNFQTREFDLYPSGNQTGIRSGFTYDLYEDESGTIWIAGFSGVTLFHPDALAFQTIDILPLGLGGSVTALAETASGDVAMGTESGLAIWSPENKEMFISEHTLSGSLTSYITSLETDYEGNLWIGTYGSGLGLITVKGELEFFDTPKSMLAEWGVTDVLYLADYQVVYLATFGAGIFRFDPNTGLFTRFPDPANVEGQFPDLKCLEIERGDAGTLWVATNDAAAFTLDLYSGRTRDFSSSNLGRYASSVLYEESTVWFASYDGELFELPTKERFPKRVDGIDSQLTKQAYGLQIEGESIWMPAAGVIVRYNRKSGAVDYFDQRQGVLSNLHWGADTKLTSGHLVFGGSTGLNLVDPKAILAHKVEASHYLSKVSVNEIDIPRVSDEGLNLSYGERNLSFALSSTDYRFPSRVQFERKLIGFDKDWINNGTKRTITYTNLDPGSYTLRVRGTNGEGVWSPHELSIPIIVNPPWWRTWWAYLVYSALALMLFYQLLLLASRRVNAEAEQKFNQRIQLYVSSLDEAAECVLNANAGGRVLYVNHAINSVLEKPVNSAIGHQLLDVLFEEEGQKETIRQTLLDEGGALDEVEVIEDAGATKTVEISIRAVPEEDQHGVAFVAVARDVTERSVHNRELMEETEFLRRELAETSKKLLGQIESSDAYIKEMTDRVAKRDQALQAVHDRVHDNLQMLSSLLNLQADKLPTDETAELLYEHQRRIKSVALVHERLLRSEQPALVPMHDYVEILVASLSRTLSPKHLNIELIEDIGEAYLSIEQAVPLGLIVNELTSNAFIHAFAEKTHGSGRVKVLLYAAAGECVLQVEDDGLGLPVDFHPGKASSIGFEIVSVLVEQLGGSFSFIRGTGTAFEVRFPVS